MDAAERGTEAAGPPKVLAEPATAAEAPPQPEFIPLPDEEEEDDDDDDDDDESSSSEHDSAHEFGPAGADDSSSWEDSEEEQETHEPIDRDKLPAWLSRRRKQGSDDDEDEGDTAPAAQAEPAAQLPPLLISPLAPGEEIALAGVFTAVVGPLIVVQAKAGVKTLDDGSIVCTADGVIIGEVEETFGPVQAPLYAVRRCHTMEADAVQALSGKDAYFVINRSNFIVDIQKLHVKGYDASGQDDQELEEEEEFSDDEEEELARQKRRQNKRGANGEEGADPPDVAAAGNRQTGRQGQQQRRPHRQGGRGSGPQQGHGLHQGGSTPPAMMPMWLNPWGGMQPWGAVPGGQAHWLGGPPSGQMPATYGMIWPGAMPSYGAWPQGQMMPPK